VLAQYPILLWEIVQDRLHQYVANEGYVVRVPHHPHM
jgi:hypothetical protein